MMEINVGKYLSEEEVKEIVINEIRSVARAKINGEEERLLSNAAYYIAESFCDGLITDEQKATVETQVKDILTDGDSLKYQIFRVRNVWETGTEFPIQDIIKRATHAKAPEIEEKIFNIIDKLDEDLFYKMIDDGDSHLIFDFLKEAIKLSKRG